MVHTTIGTARPKRGFFRRALTIVLAAALLLDCAMRGELHLLGEELEKHGYL